MKKFTAIALVVLMVVALVPFGAFADTNWTEVKTAKDFAAMKDGNYWLTADIDLSDEDWTTISEFTGTLNGNGHTVTVPEEAPIFDTLKGTVKNLVLDGFCDLDTNDRGSYVPANNFLNGGVSVFANYACGATITNVTSLVDVTYYGEHANFGGLVGIASAASADKKTVISNCVVDGEISFRTDALGEVATGCLIGYSCGGVEVINTEVSALANIEGGSQNAGAFVGFCLFNGSGTEYVPTLFENCLFSGNLTVKFANRVAWAGQAKGLTLKNCFISGAIRSSGVVAHFAGWGNVGNSATPNNQTNTIDGCASICNIIGSGKHFSRIKTANAHVNNCLLLADQPIGDGPAQENNVVMASADELVAEFINRNGEAFKLVDGKVTLVQPVFTPENAPFESTGTTENPEDTTAQQTENTTKPATDDDSTSDKKEEGGCKSFTVSLGATVAVVSLAAVTVLSKKRR